MDKVAELEARLNEIKDKYDNNLDNIGYIELEKVAHEIDDIRNEVQGVFQEYDDRIHREDNGRFRRAEYDISQLAELTTKINEIDDLCYDTANAIYAEANKKQIMFEGKLFRRNQIKTIARYYEFRIQNTEKHLDELRKMNSSKRNSTEIEIYESALEKYKNSYEELNNLSDELDQEIKIIREGGEIDYDKYLDTSEKSIKYMEEEGILKEPEKENIDKEVEEKISKNKIKQRLDEIIDKEKEFDVYRRGQDKSKTQDMQEEKDKDEEKINENNQSFEDKSYDFEKTNEKEVSDYSSNDKNTTSDSTNGNNSNTSEENKEVDITLPNEPMLNVPEENMEQSQAVVPKNKGKKPKITWKTVAAVAAGIGIGATVFFTTGPLGVGVMMTASGVAKRFIKNQEKKVASLTSLKNATSVRKIEEPRPGLLGAVDKFKNYIKSPEGLRDMRWMLNAAMITGAGLTVGQMAQQFYANASTPPVEPTVESVSAPTTDPNPLTMPEPIQTINPTPDTTVVDTVVENGLSYDNIKLGESVGEFNVDVGYGTSSSALSGTNAEVLNGNLINSTNSQFGRFRVFNPDGTRTIITDTGVSIQDLIDQGYDISQIAIDVTNNQGASQAWVNVSDLMGGGKGL